MNLNYFLYGLPIVAAAIGYSTNWLAIKMLFRPLEEKKLFDLRVPFTPGIIPKRREELAESIGRAVGSHLLTPAALEKRLASAEVKQQLEEVLENSFRDFLHTDRGSPRDIFSQTDDADLQKAFDRIIEKAKTWLEQVLAGDNAEKAVENILESFLEEIYKKELKVLIQNCSHEEIQIKIKNILEEVAERRDLESLIEKFWREKLKRVSLEEGCLEDYLGENLKTFILKQSESRLPDLLRKGAELLDRRKIRTKLKNFITGELEDKIHEEFDDESVWDQLKLGLLETMVMPNGKLNKKMAELIEEGIPRLVELMEREDFRQEIAVAGRDYLEEMFQRDLSDLITSQTQLEKLAGICTDFSLAIVRTPHVQSFIVEGLLEFVESSEERTFAEFLRLDREENKDIIAKSITNNLLEVLRSQEFQRKLNRMIEKKLNNFRSRKIGKLARWIDPDLITPIIGPLSDELLRIITKQGKNITQALNVKKLIKTEIESFSTREVEKVVLEVTGDQFRVITLLGGMIGFLVGLVQVAIFVLGG